MPTTIYLGAIAHSLDLQQIEYVDQAILCVGTDGLIEWIEHAAPEELQDIAAKHSVSLDDAEVVELDSDEFLCPGLIDTHTVSLSSMCRRAKLTQARAAVPELGTRLRHTTLAVAAGAHLPERGEVCGCPACEEHIRASGADDIECRRELEPAGLPLWPLLMPRQQRLAITAHSTWKRPRHSLTSVWRRVCDRSHSDGWRRD